MNAVWLANTGGLPGIVTNNPTLSSSYIGLNNRVIGANLSREITTDWTLSIDVLNTTYPRSQWVGVFNAAGTQGYGFVWTTNQAAQWGSQGTVFITKYNVAGPSSLTFNITTGATALTPLVPSGHNASNTTTAAISPPFAHFQLKWNAETHTLTLSVDGVQQATYIDTSSPYTTFSRVFVSGNTNGLFDNLSVTAVGGAAAPTAIPKTAPTTAPTVPQKTAPSAASAVAPTVAPVAAPAAVPAAAPAATSAARQPTQAQPQQLQQTVLADGFDYTEWNTGSAPMTAVWSANTGRTASIVTNNPTLSSSYISLNNGVIGANLSREITTDWTVSIDVLNTAYSRGQWVGVFNAAGTQGYGFYWSTGLADQFDSQGLVYLTKYDVAGPSALTINVTTGITKLTPPVPAGHNAGNTTTAAISPPFAHFQMSWTAETHTLTLSVDGVPKATYTDTSSPYTTFSRVFLSGNTSGLFDNLSVTAMGGAAAPTATPKTAPAAAPAATSATRQPTQPTQS
jgi:hypothetical protein